MAGPAFDIPTIKGATVEPMGTLASFNIRWDGAKGVPMVEFNPRIGMKPTGFPTRTVLAPGETPSGQAVAIKAGFVAQIQAMGSEIFMHEVVGWANTAYEAEVEAEDDAALNELLNACYKVHTKMAPQAQAYAVRQRIATRTKTATRSPERRVTIHGFTRT